MIELIIDGQTHHLPDTQRDQAMARYWGARAKGDSTAKITVVTDGPQDHGALVEQEATGESKEVPVAPGAVSPVAVSRIQLQEEWLKASGFDVPPPVYAAGTKVVALGEQNFRLERRAVQELPLFPDAALSVHDLIYEENRQDIEVGLGDIAMNEDGSLEVFGRSLGLQVPAFTQLALLCGFGMGARYLARLCSGGLRAQNVNHQLEKLRKQRRRRRLVLRTRRSGEERRTVHAVVTPTYACVDTHQVLDRVSAKLSDARTELVYDGAGARATALWMPDHVEDLAAGDIFKAGVRIETEDTGRGRIRVCAVVWRNRCLNLIIVGTGTVETVSQVHRGSSKKILKTVEEGVEQARAKIDDFLGAWGHARTVQVEPEEQFIKWLRRGDIKLPGKRDERMTVEAFMAAWGVEQGNTLADAVNAVTRAAHQTTGWGWDVRETIERQAADLVLVRA